MGALPITDRSLFCMLQSNNNCPSFYVVHVEIIIHSSF